MTITPRPSAPSNALSGKLKYSFVPPFGGAPTLCYLSQDWVERLKESSSLQIRGNPTQNDIDKCRDGVGLHAAVQILGAWSPETVEDHFQKNLFFDEVVIDLKKQVLQNCEETALHNFWLTYPQIHLCTRRRGEVLIRTRRVTDCCVEFSSDCEATGAYLLKWKPGTSNDGWECNIRFKDDVYGARFDYQQLLRRTDVHTSGDIFVVRFCVENASGWPSIFPVVTRNDAPTAMARSPFHMSERDRSRFQPSERGSHGF